MISDATSSQWFRSRRDPHWASTGSVVKLANATTPRYMPRSWNDAAAISPTRLRPISARVMSANTTNDTSEPKSGTLNSPKTISSHVGL
jgi:hypothetical protein